MSVINSNFFKLQTGYLFPTIAKKSREYQESHPDAKLIRLGIGDTTLPLAPAVAKAMSDFSLGLGTISGYEGYGDSEGNPILRESISQYYKELGCVIEASEVFVSDGAKGDCANLQSLFQDPVIAVQDPAYPVYVNSSVLAGQTGTYNSKNQYDKLVYLEGSKENGFVTDVPSQNVDIIYLCYPNNPTGAVATRAKLKEFVDYAIENKAIIIYDAAYSWFINDENIPKSIYEIEGANTCCIELNSFSKFAGFTGVRLGWSIIPHGLATETTGLNLNNCWVKRQNIYFNGPCNIAQVGGIAALSQQGKLECQELVEYYMQNAILIRETLTSIGLLCYGGDNAPFVWVKTPLIEGKEVTSWEFFDYLIENCQVIGTPGSGFGNSGEGYLRLSAFGTRENTIEALDRITRHFGSN